MGHGIGYFCRLRFASRMRLAHKDSLRGREQGDAPDLPKAGVMRAERISCGAQQGKTRYYHGSMTEPS